MSAFKIALSVKNKGKFPTSSKFAKKLWNARKWWRWLGVIVTHKQIYDTVFYQAVSCNWKQEAINKNTSIFFDTEWLTASGKVAKILRF